LHPDPAFPALHIRPPRGWLNDPNGMSYVDGIYHAFFQYNPYSARHHLIHWGHASSADLVTWCNEPVALAPRDGHADSYGCWTGTVTVEHGVPTAVYSGVAGEDGESQVLLAHSERTMRHWTQEAEPVAAMPDDARVVAARDPFILHADGHRWAVQGAGLADGRAAVIAHACDDLHRWDYCGVVVSAEHPVAATHAHGNLWECPQLFQMDGTWMLIVSQLVGTGASAALDGVAWLAGELRVQGNALRFEPVAGGRVDIGPDFYAPQALVLPDRVLLWGWTREDGRTQAEIDAVGWAGALTFPRELHVVDGALVSDPAPELMLLRRRVVYDGPRRAGGVAVSDRAFELALPSKPRSAPSTVQLVLARPDGSARIAAVVEARDGAGMRVLVDGSVVEVFVDGEPTRTSRAYPEAGETWVVHIGGVEEDRLIAAESLQVWALGLPPRRADTELPR
jgi:beta-fructofuranosidase